MVTVFGGLVERFVCLFFCTSALEIEYAALLLIFCEHVIIRIFYDEGFHFMERTCNITSNLVGWAAFKFLGQKC